MHHWLMIGIFLLLGFSLLLCFIRAIIGPSLPDRMIILDMLANLLIGFVAIKSVIQNQTIYLELAPVLALIVFLGTLAISSYIEKKGNEA